MYSLFQDIATLLVTSPGNFAYHLILVFSIAGAIQGAIPHYNDENSTGKRMVWGLVVLLASRMLLFLLATIPLFPQLDESLFIPIVDRFIATLSIIIIIWLWLFPNSSKLGDSATGIFGLITLAFAIFSALWYNLDRTIPLNLTWISAIWDIAALIIIGLGIIILVAKQPQGWGFALSTVIILGIGHTGQLLLALPQDSSLAGLTRLAQLAAFPLLLTLPNRFPHTEIRPIPDVTETIIPERKQYGFDPNLFGLVTNLAISNRESIPGHLAEFFAKFMLSDLVLITNPIQEENQDLEIIAGYDLIRESAFEGITIPGNSIPVLSAAIKNGKPLRLPSSSSSKDQMVLRMTLGLTQSGHLLTSTINNLQGKPQYGVILVTPYSQRSWSKESQYILLELCDFVAKIVQRATMWANIDDAFKQLRQDYQVLEQILKDTQQENKGLRAELKAMSERIIELQSGKDEMAALSEAHDVALETIDRQETEIDSLQKEIQSLKEKLRVIPQIDELNHELRLALEEIANLRGEINALETEKKELISQLNQQAQIPNHTGLIQIIQHIRQSMTTITGYTDLLLGESIGLLGATQRKFLERIRVSIKRIEGDLVEMLDIISATGNNIPLHSKPIEVEEILASAIDDVQPIVEQKEITLQMNIAPYLPHIEGDPNALRQALSNLLRNAVLVTPSGGTVSISGELYRTQENESYTLLKVTDQGGGIPADELPSVFLRIYGDNHKPIKGVSDSDGELGVCKAIVEAHNGRIWVDTEENKGSTFSVLLPLKQPNNSGG